MIIEASNIKFPDYIIRSNGTVISMKKRYKNREVVGGTTGEGRYRIICLYDRKLKRHGLTVHSLIAETFLGPRPKNRVIDHIDNNSFNNSLKNLRYVTPAHNTARERGKLGSNNKSGVRGVFLSKTKSGKINGWFAALWTQKKVIFRKRFKTKKEAVFARKEAEKIYFSIYD